MKPRTAALVASAKARGFDRSVALRSGCVVVRCSGCEALVINGVATHERGCPQQTRICGRCGGQYPRGQSCICFDNDCQ